MPGNAAAVITHPVNRAKKKAAPISDRDFNKLLKLAEESALRLGLGYVETVNVSAKRLAKLAAKARKDQSDRSDRIREIQDMAFELRGEGASFGFDVVSNIADSLFRTIDEAQDRSDKMTLQVVEMHALALNAMLAGGVRAVKGDKVAEQIVAALGAASAKAQSSAKQAQAAG